VLPLGRHCDLGVISQSNFILHVKEKKRCGCSGGIPRRDVDLDEPWLERLVKQDVKSKQLVTAVATSHVSNDHAVDVALSAVVNTHDAGVVTMTT